MALTYPYYPKSQITPNLYTGGGEYIFRLTKKDYKGYYYKISSGKTFTGKTPEEGLNAEIILPSTDQVNQKASPTNPGTPIRRVSVQMYSQASKQPYQDFETGNYKRIDSNYTFRYLPVFYNSSDYPRTQKELNVGEYQRYFTKKNNELVYLEIDKQTYDDFQNPNSEAATDLYSVVSLPWRIDSLPNSDLTSEEINKKAVNLVEKNNNWYGFSNYIDSYLFTPSSAILSETPPSNNTLVIPPRTPESTPDPTLGAASTPSAPIGGNISSGGGGTSGGGGGGY